MKQRDIVRRHVRIQEDKEVAKTQWNRLTHCILQFTQTKGVNGGPHSKGHFQKYSVSPSFFWNYGICNSRFEKIFEFILLICNVAIVMHNSVVNQSILKKCLKWRSNQLNLKFGISQSSNSMVPTVISIVWSWNEVQMAVFNCRF